MEALKDKEQRVLRRRTVLAALTRLKQICNHPAHYLGDGSPITPDGWQIRGIVDAFEDCVVVTASQDPVEVQVVRFGTDGAVTPITEGAAVHNALIGGPTTVITRSAVDAVGTTVMVHREGTEPAPINVVSETPPHQSVIRLMKAGKHELRTAVLLPRDHQTGSAKLPALMALWREAGLFKECGK